MAQLIDLTGQKIGHLTVLERAENKNGRVQWKCLCECGNIVVIPSNNLRHKNKERKYCSNQCIIKNNPINLVGQHFGRLTVLERFKDTENKYQSHNAHWNCQCDCGEKTIVSSYDLRTGKVKSCGCLRAEQLSKRRSIDLTGQQFGKLTVLELLYSTKTGNIWKCKCECGNYTEGRAQDLINHNKNSCGCIKSKGEMVIQSYLQQLEIPYKREFFFQDLCGKATPLRFDFALFNKENQITCLIEFDGIQHFVQGRWVNNNLEEQQLRDQKKNEYCKAHNISLIRFNYKELNENLLTLDYFKTRLANESEVFKS